MYKIFKDLIFKKQISDSKTKPINKKCRIEINC